jgi:hypothetical protein
MNRSWNSKALAALIPAFLLFSQVFSAVFIVPDHFPTIQSAVDELSQGDTIMIRPGVYYENIDISGSKYLTLTSFYESLEDPGLVYETIIDGGGNGAVINIHDNSELIVLRGLSVRNGFNDHGGGIRLVYADLVAENLVIRYNDTWDVWSNAGGGIYAVHCNLLVKNSEISYNSAYDYGGGVSVRNGGKARFENVIFIGNNTSNAYGHGKGAGLHCDYGAGVDVTRCIFSCNNSARWGGAFAANSTAKLKITNTVAFGNHAAWGGGGLYLCYFDARIDIGNSIFYLNYPQEIYFDDNSGGHSDSVIVFHSIIQGGQAGVSVPPTMYLEWLEGNKNQDPGFTDPQNFDFSLTAGSSCVDAGTELLVLRNDTLVYIPEENWYGYAPDMGGKESQYLAGQPENPQQHDAGIIITPNPCRDQVKIRTFDPDARIHEIQVINREGKIVADDGNLADLPPGLYTVKVNASNGSFFAKILKVE